MHLLIIVPQPLYLHFFAPRPQRLTHIPARILCADHEPDLPTGVRGDGGVGVFDDGEDLAAGLLESGDEGEVEPLVFGLGLVSGVYVGRERGEGREGFWLVGEAGIVCIRGW